MTFNTSQEINLTELLRLMNDDFEEFEKQRIFFDHPPYTAALQQVKSKENSWVELGFALKEIAPSWMQHVGYLMELENRRVREEKGL